MVHYKLVLTPSEKCSGLNSGIWQRLSFADTNKLITQWEFKQKNDGYATDEEIKKAIQEMINWITIKYPGNENRLDVWYMGNLIEIKLFTS
jgi:hypothetical protein